jgi:hypothetical protein
MRTYIFTALERKQIRRLLAGERDDAIWKLAHRIRKFDDLKADVMLYLEASKAILAEK